MPGLVGLAQDGQLVAVAALDQSQRNARDLTPLIQRLTSEAGWLPKDITAIAASIGPGSYTGLRVGLMTAKALCHALGCKLIAVPTFEVYALNYFTNHPQATQVQVTAPALKKQLYHQAFGFSDKQLKEESSLLIISEQEWQQRETEPNTGPTRLGPPSTELLSPLLQRALHYMEQEVFDDPITLEPLYVSASSAEVQMNTASTK